MPSHTIDYYKAISQQFGAVKRARGYYLYTQKGTRLTDMYLDGGKALFGRKWNRLNVHYKQILDRGLTGFFPSFQESRLHSLMSDFFSGWQVFVYSSLQKAQVQAQELTHQPALTWRPFYPMPVPRDEPTALIPLLPHFGSTSILLYANTGGQHAPLPAPSDPIIPLEAEMLTQVIHGLKQAQPPHTVPIRPLLEKIWHIEAQCYLFPKISPEQYAHFFHSALQGHILVSPDYDCPSIIPQLSHYSELAHVLSAYERFL